MTYHAYLMNPATQKYDVVLFSGDYEIVSKKAEAYREKQIKKGVHPGIHITAIRSNTTK